MTILSNTYTRYGAIGLREQLADLISDLSPMDTPGVTMSGRGTATQTLFEWQTDALAAAATNNQQLEGDDLDQTGYTATTATVRVGNYTQIARKDFIISGTVDAVSKAGRNSEIAYQIPRRGREIKRDQEAHMWANVGGDAGGTATARVSASMGAWIKTNDFVSTSGGSPTYTSGVPGAARTNGTQQAFTETNLKTVIESCWTNGGTPDSIMVGPVNKKRMSENFSGLSTSTHQIDVPDRSPTVSVASIDFYVSDFGTFKIIPNRFQQERDAWLIDYSLLKLMVLRNYHVTKLAKTGDAEKRMMIIEYGLMVENELGLGLVADLTTT
jgi:hypothetical protein